MSASSRFVIDEKIYESNHSIIYRARDFQSEQPVILKILQPVHPPPEKIARFKREYEITSSLSKVIPDVILPYSLETYEDQWMIVMEDFGGEALARLNLFGQLTLNEFLEFAIQIVNILKNIHQQGVIHKDVNPANIVLNQKTGQLKFIDFGTSTRLSRETPIFRIPELLEGTPAYISPEQTGRMNRLLDYRADFYSLGISFYQLLTGQTPFETSDLLELIHSHIARMPQSLEVLRSDIPLVVNEIVMKLLAKNAEDRYQSAHGLQADLDVCLRQHQASGRIEPISLGKYDYSDQLQLPQKLYGREKEVETLLEAIGRVGVGGRELMLVTGGSGVGKSMLVQEIYKTPVLKRGYFLNGKFDQLQRDIPYSAIIQALRGLMRQLLAEAESRLELWRERLLNVIGPNGQVLIDLLPELELIIGIQVSVPELSPLETKNRLHLLMLNFLRVFASAEHPLVIFLDDLQWADGASINLLSYLLAEIGLRGFLVLGAYRDSEVGDQHLLRMSLVKMEQTGIDIHTINLPPLGLADTINYLADALLCTTQKAKPLAELLLTKTDGNPFFLAEYLKSLHADGLLTFVPPSEQWAGFWLWDLNRVRAQNLAGNVVELLVKNVQELPDATRRALRLAACLGNHFELETLSLVTQTPPHETAKDLWPALDKGMLLPLGYAYQLAEQNVQGLTKSLIVEYKFVHDRVQQATYLLMSESERRETHLQIGRWLLEKIPVEDRDLRVFEIVNHLNHGSSLISDEAECVQLVELNWRAGRRAKASTAYAEAYRYFCTSFQLLNGMNMDGKDVDPAMALSWESHPDLTLALCEDLAEAAYLSGHMDIMDRMVDTVISRCESTLDKIRVYEIKFQALVSQGSIGEAVQFNLSALALLGIRFPAKVEMSHIALALIRTGLKLTNKKPEALAQASEMTDPRALAIMRLMMHVLPATYLSDPRLFLLEVLKVVDISIKFGNAITSPGAYASYGLVLCGRVGNIDLGYRLGKLSCQLVDKLNMRQYFAHAYFPFDYGIRHWKEPLSATLPTLWTSHQTDIEAGDLEHASYCVAQYSWHFWMAGNDLPQSLQTLEICSDVCRQIKQPFPQMIVQLAQQAVINLMGQTLNPLHVRGEICDEVDVLSRFLQAKGYSWVFSSLVLKVFLCMLFGDYTAALENINKAEKFKEASVGAYISVLFPFYRSLVQLALITEHTGQERVQTIKQVRADLKNLKKWAEHSPANHKHKWHLVEAELARVEGRVSDAREHYDQAATLARQNGFLHEDALVHELAGHFYEARGQNSLARYYLREAHSVYRRWGAVAKTRQMENIYPYLVEMKALSTTTTTDRHVAATLDLISILHAAQAISAEISLDKLLEKLMQVTIANAGAQIGYLLLEQDGQWVIEAEGSVDNQIVSVLQSLPINAEKLPITLINLVVHTHKGVVIANALQDDTLWNDPYVLTQKPLSMLCMPLINQGKTVALLYLENNLVPDAFTPARFETLRLISAEASIALENARLYTTLEHANRTLEERVIERTRELLAANTELERLANHDSLTGALSRRRFFELGTLEHERSQRYGHQLSILMIDLDHFKSVNDLYGHSVGDVVLQTAIEYVDEILRSNDLLGRYGGEEFVVLLPETSAEGAHHTAERIRHKLEATPMFYDTQKISITTSIGLASMQAGESIDQLVDRADAALYAAKRAGRNCVMRAAES